MIDEPAFAKKGTQSVGVARQYNGRLGKADNCQVGDFLIEVTPAGMALLDHQLCLPGSWYDGPDATSRRVKVHVPQGLPSAPSRRSPPNWSAMPPCWGA